MKSFYESDVWANMSDEEKEYARLQRLVRTIFYICDLAGFHVEERFVLRDKFSGRIWR